MIKKGIECQIISPSLLLKVSVAMGIESAVTGLPLREFKVCEVCKSKSLWLCHLVCKYRKANYTELCEIKKGE